jgi:hypothetical protein
LAVGGGVTGLVPDVVEATLMQRLGRRS